VLVEVALIAPRGAELIDVPAFLPNAPDFIPAMKSVVASATVGPVAAESMPA
jgi:hypothetical protein